MKVVSFVLLILISISILWLYFIVDPLERRLIFSYLRYGTFTQEIISQGLGQDDIRPGKLGQKITIILTKFLVILGLIIYPIASFIYLIIKPSGKHSLTLWQKYKYHLAHPISLPCLGGGGLYSILSYIDKSRESYPEGGKVFWIKHFEKHGVGYPKVFSISDGLPQQDLIVKPIRGSRGRGLEFWKYNPVDHRYVNRKLGLCFDKEALMTRLKNKKGLSLVTEFISSSTNSPYPGHSQNLRIITYRPNNSNRIEVFTLQYNVQLDKDEISSNSNDTPTVYTEIGTDKIINGMKLSISGLDRAIEEAKRLHSDLPLFSIGWDVILSDQGPMFLEGNQGHGLGNKYEADDYYDTVHRYERLFRSSYGL